MGELKKILIGHNNKGSAPGWFLERIFIEDMEENRIYEFTCEKWLATDEDDGQISRFIFAKKGTDGVKAASPGKFRSLLSTKRSPLLSLNTNASDEGQWNVPSNCCHVTLETEENKRI